MNEVLAVPISVHSDIPISVLQGRKLTGMAKAGDEHVEDDGDGINPVLAKNFLALMGKRAVAQLRADMAADGIAIGANAIQLAKKGSKGLRLGTLEKFARYFGCSVADLICVPDVADDWPFPDLTPEFFAGLTDGQRYELQGLLRRAVGDFREDESGGESPESAQRAAGGMKGR
jgi:DNA-binding Xre family transcriptional regulator